MPEGLIGYKGFYRDDDGNLTCITKKYEIGKIHQLGEDRNEYKKLKLCENGFHFCLLPIDVFTYYTFYNLRTEYYKIKAYGNIIKEKNDTKMATDKMEILEKISIKDMFLESIRFLSSPEKRKYNKFYDLDPKSRLDSTCDNTFYKRHHILLSNTNLRILYNGGIDKNVYDITNMTISTGSGSWAISDIPNSLAITYTNKAYWGNAVTTEKNSIAISKSLALCLDDNSIAISDDMGMVRGRRSICVSNRKYSDLVATGPNSILCSTESSTMHTTGENSVIVKNCTLREKDPLTGEYEYKGEKDPSTGKYKYKEHNLSNAEGKNSVIVDLSEKARFKGGMGTVFVAAEYYDVDETDENYGKIKKLHTVTVDGIEYKENTEYVFSKNKFKFVIYFDDDTDDWKNEPIVNDDEEGGE